MKSQQIPINQIIQRVKHLVIRARKLVSDTLQSEYHSVFKGRGIEFNEVRGYLPGDDVRDIDWNVTARMNQPFVKTYIEERQLTVIFAVDISNSMYFGGQKSKRQIMAEIVALLGFASFFNNDKAGLVLFSSDIEKVVPPVKNESHLLRIIRDTWYYQPLMKGTSLTTSLFRLMNLLKKRTIIFVLSDFLDAGFEKPLMGLCKRHEVIPIVIHDFMEERLNFNLDTYLPVLIEMEDIETGASRVIDLSVHRISEIKRYRNYYRQVFTKLSLDYVEVNNTIDYFKKIELMLRRRNQRR